MNTRIKPILIICLNLAFAWHFGLLPVFAVAVWTLLWSKYFPALQFWLLPAFVLIGQRWTEQSIAIGGLGGTVILMQLWSALGSPQGSLPVTLASVTWFPSVLAGPIHRDAKLTESVRFNLRQDPSVYLLLAAGFLKCSGGVFLAQHISNLENIIRLGSAPTVVVGALISLMLFYCQLSGMTDIAIGISRFFNVNLPRNFDSPLRARDLTDFWRRWHITLNQWFFHEVYLPLALSFQRHFPKVGKPLTILVLFFTAILVGLWHGFTGPFLLWGLLNGFLLVLFSFWKGWLANIVSWLGILFLFLIMRLEDISSVTLVLSRMTHFNFTDLQRSLPSVLILSLGLLIIILISKARPWQIKVWPLMVFLYLLAGFLLGRPFGQVLYPGF